MPRMALSLAMVGIVTLSACTDSADVFPTNDKAKALGPVTASFVRTGVGRGPITMTMGDGEVLKGEYRVAYGGTEAFAFSAGQTASALVIGDGNVQFVMTGPQTEMLCRGTNTISGHGNGECQTFDGAVWAISW